VSWKLKITPIESTHSSYIASLKELNETNIAAALAKSFTATEFDIDPKIVEDVITNDIPMQVFLGLRHIIINKEKISSKDIEILRSVLNKAIQFIDKQELTEKLLEAHKKDKPKENTKNWKLTIKDAAQIKGETPIQLQLLKIMFGEPKKNEVLVTLQKSHGRGRKPQELKVKTTNSNDD